MTGISYPEELPVSAFRDALVASFSENPVTVVCGDTGSGKTTQLPKMLIEAGCAPEGKRVACTQPRRIAAVSVAERVAAELKSECGGLAGYRHRFADKTSPRTKIEFMTDGILLAETRSDPLLGRYGAIIVDEAHERSLNIDFLLGILKRILAKRRDLKVVVSSATMDSGRFSAFFGGAPVVAVPGRTYPVETVWMPPADGEAADLPREIAAALRAIPPAHDTLVFLPGERDIRETADALGRDPDFRKDDILPLIASLPAGELAKAFRLSPRRRIILATNVAETSVTIPGVRAVVDSGLARIPRYIHRTKVQRLQIERISRASAKQRQGRCGRTGPGVCVRLYSEEDFATRDEYTPPEIQRSSLAGVILTMLDLRLGDIELFPFMDPPKPASVREGLRELLELDAIRHDPQTGEIALTPSGRRLAAIPVEPRLAKMLLAASSLATLPSALPVVAAMSCDDPRRRPIDEREKADAAHAQFKAEGSDFLGDLKLWKWWEEKSAELSQTQLRRLAEKTYLSFQKMREWRDITRQLKDLAVRLGLDAKSDNGGTDALHKALLSGLLGRIGKLDPETREYRGSHGTRFAIHPGSVLAKRAKKGKEGGAPEWVMAGELVDTSRLFARDAAQIDPEWIERVAGRLCKRSWHDECWDAQAGFARAVERVTLYGLVIVEGRRRDLSRLDPAKSRELFVLHALVLGEMANPPREAAANLRVIREMRDASERARRPELFDADAVAAHFDASVPKEIVSVGALRRWLAAATPEELAKFELRRAEWIRRDAAEDSKFPRFVNVGDAKLRLVYRHCPSSPEDDGVTCVATAENAPALRLWNPDRLVPGMLPEKIGVVLGAMTSAVRRALPPLADAAAILAPAVAEGGGTFSEALCRAVAERFGVRIKEEAVEAARLPPHLKMRYEIRDAKTGRTIAASRNLDEVLSQAGADGPAAKASGAGGRRAVWDFPDGFFGEQAAGPGAGNTLRVPVRRALRDCGDAVEACVFADAAEARAVHVYGVARLMAIAIAPKRAAPPRRFRSIPFDAALHMKTIGYTEERLDDDLTIAAIVEAALRDLPEVLVRRDFDARLRERRGAIAAAKAELERIFASAMRDLASCSARVRECALAPDVAGDIAVQTAWLVHPGFMRAVPLRRLEQYGRYFKAISVRIDRARTNLAGDRSKAARFAPCWTRYRELAADRSAKVADRAALAEYRWMLEEYRISLFAQEIRTAAPVSPNRLDALWRKAVAT